jgi:hypothetical protein
MQNTPVSFHVDYRLGEYLKLLFRHVLADVTRHKEEQGKQTGWMDLLVLRATLYLFAPPIFLFKLLRIGKCDFTFDDAGIVRNSKAGELVLPWDKISEIYEYPEGFLFAKENGALPVPLRVLTDSQVDALKAYESSA